MVGKFVFVLFVLVFLIGFVSASGIDLTGFSKTEIGNKGIYYKQRVIDGVKIEKDFSVYEFDKGTGSLLNKKDNFRNIGEIPKAKITREEAESKVFGKVLFSELILIAPDSDVFPLEPKPKNPVWAVRVEENGMQKIVVVDSINGKILGRGIVPPYNAFSFSGPIYSGCSDYWYNWYNNAALWFGKMGYDTEYLIWPTKDKIRSHVQSNETALFYELAHGGSSSFGGGCLNGSIQYTSYADIRNWISNYTKMPFSFIGSCEGLCNTGSGTLSYEFRKGSNNGTASVGYCGMSSQNCSSCWSLSVMWQTRLFLYLNQSYTAKQAFDMANIDYPVCAQCMRFSGDENLKLVPKVVRVTYCDSADLNKDGIVDLSDLSILSVNWGLSGSGDINKDGIVDLSDLSILSSNWGISTGACS